MTDAIEVVVLFLVFVFGVGIVFYWLEHRKKQIHPKNQPSH